MKTKKSILRTFVLMFTFSIIFSGAFSQDKKEKRIIKIKTEDGKTIIDTIIAKKGEVFFLDEEMLKKLDLDSEDFKHLKEKLKDIQIRIGEDSDLYMSDTKDGETISIWSTSVDDNDSTIRLMVKTVTNNDDSYIYTIKDGDLKEGDKNYKVISMTTSGGAIGIDGDADANTIIFKSYGKEGDSSCYVYMTDFADGKNVKKMNIFMDGKCNMTKGEKSYTYVFGDDDGDIIHINCFSGKDLDEKDIETLKGAGVNYEKNALDLGEMFFYPNPSDGEFNLKFDLEEKGDVIINIIDFKGEVIYNEELKNFSGKYDKEIDIKEQPAGTYFLNVQQNGKMSTSKIIITS